MNNEDIKKRIDWECKNEIYSDKGIECPHCHYLNTDPEDIYFLDYEKDYMECGACMKRFSVKIDVSYSWTSTPIHPEFNPDHQ